MYAFVFKNMWLNHPTILGSEVKNTVKKLFKHMNTHLTNATCLNKFYV